MSSSASILNYKLACLLDVTQQSVKGIGSQSEMLARCDVITIVTNQRAASSDWKRGEIRLELN